MTTESKSLTLVCDLDGVVWRGDEPVAGSAAALAELRAAGFAVLFQSNNSYATPVTICAKLVAMGISAQPTDLITSASAAVTMLDFESTSATNTRVLVLGGPGLREAIVATGAELVKPSESIDSSQRNKIDFVVVGFDPDFDFTSVAVAADAIRAGSRFIATNRDPTYPVPGGVVPGAGALVAAVAVASGCEPEVAGKPEPPSVALTRTRLGDYAVMVGDRPSTDGAFAHALGIDFALVLSGVTTRTAQPGGETIPDPAPRWVGEDLSSLTPQLLAWAAQKS